MPPDGSLYDLHGLEVYSSDPAQHPIWKGEDLDGLDRDLSTICPTCETVLSYVYRVHEAGPLQTTPQNGKTRRYTAYNSRGKDESEIAERSVCDERRISMSSLQSHPVSVWCWNPTQKGGALSGVLYGTVLCPGYHPMHRY